MRKNRADDCRRMLRCRCQYNKKGDCGASRLFYTTMWRSAPIQLPILKTVTNTPPINLKLENMRSITSKVSLIKIHSQVAGLKNRIRAFLSFQTTSAQGYLTYCFSSLECIVAWSTLDISFATLQPGSFQCNNYAGS